MLLNNNNARLAGTSKKLFMFARQKYFFLFFHSTETNEEKCCKSLSPSSHQPFFFLSSHSFMAFLFPSQASSSSFTGKFSLSFISFQVSALCSVFGFTQENPPRNEEKKRKNSFQNPQSAGKPKQHKWRNIYDENYGRANG